MQSNDKAFEIFAPDGRYIFVSSAEHIKELDKAPDTVLSLQAASKQACVFFFMREPDTLILSQMLQPKYTMHGFNWFDRRGTEGVGFIRALRTLLTCNLPHILPDLGVAIKYRFTELHSSHPVINGMSDSFPRCSILTLRQKSGTRQFMTWSLNLLFWQILCLSSVKN